MGEIGDALLGLRPDGTHRVSCIPSSSESNCVRHAFPLLSRSGAGAGCVCVGTGRIRGAPGPAECAQVMRARGAAGVATRKAGASLRGAAHLREESTPVN